MREPNAAVATATPGSLAPAGEVPADAAVDEVALEQELLALAQAASRSAAASPASIRVRAILW